MNELDVVVRRAGNSIDLRVPKPEARRLGLVEGRRLRIAILDAPDLVDLLGSLEGIVSAEELHAATNEDEDLE